ncbi:MAG TPA: phospholipid carrier-dependent glycosyltransferase [Vicinamibacteria bacterium]|nr:phospholipid carrier-dependent glycosyltransferase [Vicinamibacteria bacterium]
MNLAGLTWGLPARWHPDEKADAAARMAREGTLEPESFINPSLPLYVEWPVLLAQARAAEAGWLRGRAADPLLAGRVLSALAGAAAVWTLGLAAGRMRRDLSVLAAALFALSPGVVNLCHFATPEPWLLLGTAATLLLALDHLRGRRGVALLGITLGLTAATKYTAAALLVPCLVAVWLRPRTGEDRTRLEANLVAVAGAVLVVIAALLATGPGHALAGSLHLPDARLLRPESAAGFVQSMAMLLAAAGAALVVIGVAARRGAAWAGPLARVDAIALAALAAIAFAAATPYAVLRAPAFLSDLAFNQQTRHEYKGLASASTSFWPYLELLAGALTGPLAVTAVAGTIVAAARGWRGDRAAAVAFSAAVAPYLLVASSGHQAMRFLAPALPAAALCAALALRAIPPPPARATLAGLVLARAALGTALVLRLFFVDSRYAAARWLEANVPPAAPVDLIANSPGYGPARPRGSLRIVPTLSREMAPPDRFRAAASAYRREGAPWLVLTASYYERFLDHPDQAPERAAFFRDLLEGRGGYEVAARFRQSGWRRPPAEFVDPEIVVLKKTDAPAAPVQLPTR